MAEKMSKISRQYGALDYVEAVADDVKKRKVYLGVSPRHLTHWILGETEKGLQLIPRDKFNVILSR